MEAAGAGFIPAAVRRWLGAHVSATCSAWGRIPFPSSSTTGQDDGRSLRPTAASSTTSGTPTQTTCRTSATGTSSISPTVDERRVKKNLEYIKVLALKFVQDDSSAPEIWLSELNVTWVLDLAHVNESGPSFISGQLLHLARSWILALFEITKSIAVYFGDGKPAAASIFIRFIEATLSKMLPFVDAIVAGTKARWRALELEPADVKLQALLLLRGSLSTASEQILAFSLYFTGELQDLLSAELRMAKLDEAIWDTTENANIGVMSSSWGTRRPSSDIHPITRSLISYIKVLWDNYGSVNRILCDAFLHGKLVPPNENVTHLSKLTTEMVHCLEEKLTRESQPFPDQSLKFLFLINNFHYILQQLDSPLGASMLELAGKIEYYINGYIQVSWAPVLKCLHTRTLGCFTRRSPLAKFESKFLKTFTVHKLWKVPDPQMRKMMREAIVEQVIPD